MEGISKVTVFNSSNALKVLSFLAASPEKDFISSEIQAVTKLSRPGVYLALKDLARQHLVHRHSRGNLLIYSFNHDNFIAKQFKVLFVTVSLESLVSKLITVSRKIILFGSASRGEDMSDSDIDLFVLARDNEAVNKILSSYKSNRKTQVIVKTQAELAEWKEKNPVFYKEIERGITLAEEKER